MPVEREAVVGMGNTSSPGDTVDQAAPSRRRLSLLAHLMALVLAVAVVALGVGGYLSARAFQDARSRATASLRDTVDLAARGVRQDLENVRDETTAFAPSVVPAFAAAVAGVELASVCTLAYSPRVLFPTGDQHLLDTSGAVACTSRRSALGTSYAGEPWFAGLAGGAPAISYMRQDPVTGEPAVAVAASVAGANGKTAGYVVTAMAIEPLAAALAELYGGTAGYAFAISDGSGRVVSSSSPTQGRPLLADGLHSTSRTGATGGRVVGSVTESAALAPARDELRRQEILMATALGALVLLALGVHRRFLRPVRVLSQVVTRAGGERGVQAPETGPAELAALAGDLNRMLVARDEAEARLAELAAALQQSGRLLVEAREQERLSLGVHLHDGPIQDMMLTGWALDSIAVPPEVTAEANRRLQAAVSAARAIEADLRPPRLVDSGLSEAVAELVGRRRADSPFEIEVHDRLAGLRFPLHTELLVYRCVQEALHNARTHSRPNRVTVSLEHDDGVVVATVTDDGVGVDEEQMAARAAARLASMRDTVTLSGGRFHIGRRGQGGTEVRVEAPVAEASRAGARGRLDR
jgi:signal transduction histidine kinase